ncbi:MAG: hypothetical protein Q8L34_00945 [Candidatus Woesearchaeota archaeon]|nr:hypothetical protein [Candidatus Woesearchaeota archaeon]
MKDSSDCAKYESLVAALKSGQDPAGMSDYEIGVFMDRHMRECPTGYHTARSLDQENFLRVGPETTDPQELSALKQRILQSLLDKLKEE